MYNNNSSLCYDISQNITTICNHNGDNQDQRLHSLFVVLLCIIISILGVTLINCCLSTKR